MRNYSKYAKTWTIAAQYKRLNVVEMKDWGTFFLFFFGTKEGLSSEKTKLRS